MALVGMASKPLHVRRLQKALQEWVTNPSLFQAPLPSNGKDCSSGSIQALSHNFFLFQIPPLAPCTVLSQVPALDPPSAIAFQFPLRMAEEVLVRVPGL